MNDKTEIAAPTRSDEIITFLLVTFVIIPALAVGAVGGYGFLVWMMQLIQGPPGS
ncbi:MAG: periplasmic nitrate reductase, NapE protein [Hyphomicrobiales bacterium]